MFKKTVLSLFVIGFTTCSYAQSFIGASIGTAFTNAVTSEKAENNTAMSYKLDLVYEYVFPKHLLLETGLTHYASRFESVNVFISENAEQLSYSQSNHNYYYVGIPLKIGYTFGDRLSVALKAGIIPAYLVKGVREEPEETIPDNSDRRILKALAVEDPSESKYPDSDYANKFSLAATAEFNFQYAFNKKSHLFTSFGFMRSFTSVTNDRYLPEINIYNYGFTVNVGMKYRIGN